MPLTTLENVKEWLGIGAAVTTDDALLERMVEAASCFVEGWLNRGIAPKDYVEVRDGTGSGVLMFANYPVNSVTSVSVGGVSFAPSTGQNSIGYVFDQTRLMLRGGIFRRDMANVQLAYNAGYATTPADIEQATIELVGLRYREKDRIGQVSKSLAGEVVMFSQKDMSDSIKTALWNYRRVAPL